MKEHVFYDVEQYQIYTASESDQSDLYDCCVLCDYEVYIYLGEL